MQSMTRRLGAVLVSTLFALGASAGMAGATTERPEPKHPGTGVSQVLEQRSDTVQKAKSESTAKQFVPVNVNLPIGVLSFDGEEHRKGSSCGKCGDSRWNGNSKGQYDDNDVKQENEASAESWAKNEAVTVQYADQEQHAGKAPNSQPPYQHKSGDSKSSDPKCGCDSNGSSNGTKGDDGVSQRLDQDSDTYQKAESEAKAFQFVPINVNAPISVLSHGSNNGDVDQENEASAESSAKNESVTVQYGEQHQTVTPAGNSAGWSNDGATQSAEQDSDTTQKAESKAEAVQVLPINANVPISILSHGSNGGDVEQENEASAESEAANSAGTFQIGTQSQQLL